MTSTATPVVTLSPPEGWGVGQEVPPEVFVGLSENEMLAEMENIERLTAWLAARAVSLTEQLVLSREAASEDPLVTDSARAARLHRAEVHAGLEDEIALATGITGRGAHTRMAMVVGDPQRAHSIRAALARGELSWARAMQAFSAVSCVDAETVPGVVEAITAPYPARSIHGVGGLLVPQPIFTARLSRQVAKHSTRQRRHREALADRHTYALLDHEDGTGRFTVTGHAGRIAGAHERVDEMGRRLRREGDPRTVSQLRSDLALDLLLFGELPQCRDILGDLPAARVHVTVSLACLLGAVDEPGVVDAVGRREWLAAPIVRRMAVAAGSTWTRLVTDPATGHLVDLSTTSYAVTGRLRDRVLARDGITRAPGRMTPASRCDTDHDIDHAAGGPTSEANVSAKDRRGHNHKTRRTWTSVREPGINGEITWTTPTGRTYATTPWDHRDLDPTPFSPCEAASLSGRESAPAESPPPRPASWAPPDEPVALPSPPPSALTPPAEEEPARAARATAPMATGAAAGDAPLHPAQTLHALSRETRRRTPPPRPPVPTREEAVLRHADVTGLTPEGAEADIRILIDTELGLDAGDSSPADWRGEDDGEPRGIRTLRRPSSHVRAARAARASTTPWHLRSVGPPPF